MASFWILRFRVLTRISNHSLDTCSIILISSAILAVSSSFVAGCISSCAAVVNTRLSSFIWTDLEEDLFNHIVWAQVVFFGIHLLPTSFGFRNRKGR
ncbi:hypothetical protein L1887_36032 [Cichorium endivia]|nr:hypothetical protein L1887_36032 [Cichorium endivia]